MKLVLQDKLTISEIKTKFTEYFPYLKLFIFIIIYFNYNLHGRQNNGIK